MELISGRTSICTILLYVDVSLKQTRLVEGAFGSSITRLVPLSVIAVFVSCCTISGGRGIKQWLEDS
jgi:hypothetical protein